MPSLRPTKFHFFWLSVFVLLPSCIVAERIPYNRVEKKCIKMCEPCGWSTDCENLCQPVPTGHRSPDRNCLPESKDILDCLDEQRVCSTTQTTLCEYERSAFYDCINYFYFSSSNSQPFPDL